MTEEPAAPAETVSVAVYVAPAETVIAVYVFVLGAA